MIEPEDPLLEHLDELNTRAIGMAGLADHLWNKRYRQALNLLRLELIDPADPEESRPHLRAPTSYGKGCEPWSTQAIVVKAQ